MADAAAALTVEEVAESQKEAQAFAARASAVSKLSSASAASAASSASVAVIAGALASLEARSEDEKARLKEAEAAALLESFGLHRDSSSKFCGAPLNGIHARSRSGIIPARVINDNDMTFHNARLVSAAAASHVSHIRRYDIPDSRYSSSRLPRILPQCRTASRGARAPCGSPRAGEIRGRRILSDMRTKAEELHASALRRGGAIGVTDRLNQGGGRQHRVFTLSLIQGKVSRFPSDTLMHSFSA